MPDYCQETFIERTNCILPDAFHERYLSGSGRPIIVTDALTKWKACTAWSFELFKSRYGSDGVVASIWPGDKWLKAMALKDYIEHLDTPGQPSPGFWMDPSTKLPCLEPSEPPAGALYLTGWRAFDLHPELLEDIQVSPSFVEDWLPLLPQPFRKVLDHYTGYYSSGILLGPPGSTASLHQDFLHSHAYLAQIAGRKSCTLFSPDDSASLYNGKIELARPNLERFPLFRNAVAFQCILEPGELLFIPARWWHHVVALEKSITVNYNFFNRSNFSDYVTDLLRDLPSILNGLERSPDEKAALGIRWSAKNIVSQYEQT